LQENLRANGNFYPKYCRTSELQQNQSFKLVNSMKTEFIFRLKSEHNYSEKKRQKNARFVYDALKTSNIQMLRLCC